MNVSVLWLSLSEKLHRVDQLTISPPQLLQTMSTVGLGFHSLPLPTILTYG